MEQFEVEGLVIDKIDIGESDRIITLFEKSRGKIKVLIKGIRKSKNREIYATDPLVLGSYKLKKKVILSIKLRIYKDISSLKKLFLIFKNGFFSCKEVL